MKLKFTYPAYYEEDEELIKVEIPDLEIGPFFIPQEKRSSLHDIAWELAAQKVTQMIQNGITPPESVTLDDLEISENETRDAFMIVLSN